MKIGSFRGKPSKSHILWTRGGGEGTASKRFDEAHFRRWVAHCGFDFDKQKRIDHDRADVSRLQFRCVFRWGTREEKSVQIGESELNLGSQKTPIAFIEIDEAGQARIKVGRTESIYDLAELRHEGKTLLLTTESGEKKKLDGEKLS